MLRQVSKKEGAPAVFVPTADYCQRIRAGSYIGRKGYTIPKALLHPDDLKFLYHDLFMVPSKNGPTYGAPGDQDQQAFPVYRENANKIYLPRFYGMARYGAEVATKDLATPASIACPFTKTLRDYQETIVGCYMKAVGPLDAGPRVPPVPSGGIIQIRCGAGKTVMAIKILSLIRCKTLIIVHKEFLLNQWVERINEFMPEARIGRIQGPVFDVADKDVVIGMLQTVYDREFPEGAFDAFGLTIVDEVHRIGSCQFSRALLRIQTPMMLGITATLERKDGLTRVIHHFMGPTVYSDTQGLQADDDTVLVRAMEFVSRDPEFNEVVTDYRGNTQVSTMITKLCNHGPRTRFLVDILRGLVDETPEAQILVLGHNRSLLVDLHAAIVDLDLATVGYYLGGMKTAALEATTEKQIILATYAMAAEGFDHKNLSILVMVTPKTDIVQSVGRIFRTKHPRHLIVDVVDTHDSFKSQWNRRRVYYKKSGFRIQHCLSTEPTVWKTLHEPRAKGAGGGSAGGAATAKDDDPTAASPGCLIPLGDLEEPA